MSDALQVKVDLKELRQEMQGKLLKEITDKFEKEINKEVSQNYAYGHYVKQYINEWVQKNLKEVVIKELESVDLKAKVEQAVERATLDIVRQQLKNINI